MIPKDATDQPPSASGAQRVYLARKRAETVFWAFWSADRKQWSLPYHGTAGIPPMFDMMAEGGHLKWSAPGVNLHWRPLDSDPVSKPYPPKRGAMPESSPTSVRPN